MRSLADEFRAFILRGNVLDLAVAVVIGAAFGAVITSLVENILTPLIAAIFGKPDFSNLSFTINNSQIMYGAFLNAIIAFLLVAAALFFFVIKPFNLLMSRRKQQAEADPTTRECPYCMTVVPIAATRCPACTSDLKAA
ncbi:MAG: large conductance mechanosensitive channel protein MscL [Thermomicrobiales bacterium]|nr:large conductance mechanosensitive channel protein MscL [Thermomicrobiales bacterium]